MFERTAKVFKQGGLTITIPKIYAEALGINIGDSINLSLDLDNKCFSVNKLEKVKSDSQNYLQNIIKILKEYGISDKDIKTISEQIKKS